MKHFRSNGGAFLTLCLVMHASVARSAASPEPVWPGPVNREGLPDWVRDMVFAEREPVVRALDPEEAERALRMHPRDDADRSNVNRQQEAILPQPVTGRELVDQIQTEQVGRWGLGGLPRPGKEPPRVFQRYRLAAPFVLPVARGA